MSVIIILILASLAIGLVFLGAFIWSVRSGQYDDTLTPGLRVLLEDAGSNDLPKTENSVAPGSVLNDKRRATQIPTNKI